MSSEEARLAKMWIKKEEGRQMMRISIPAGDTSRTQFASAGIRSRRAATPAPRGAAHGSRHFHAVRPGGSEMFGV